MKRSTRMMMMSRDGDNEYDRMDDKFRDRRGREHYDNGRYAESDGWMESRYDDMGRRRYESEKLMPMRNGYSGYAESRQRRDSRGRYMEYGHPVEDRYYGGAESRYSPYVPPIYEMERDEPMNKIGFSVDGEIHPSYRSDVSYERMHEMDNMRGNEMTKGAYGGHRMQLDRATAETWAQHMKNADGTTGPHWNMEQVKQVMAQRGIEEDPLMFWLALNAEYSDRCKQYQKHKISTIDMYVDGALDFWLHDEDAVKDKLAAYYECIVKH